MMGEEQADDGGSQNAATERLVDPANRRGQTTVDYAIGITTFLLVLAFVFAFIPSITGPFTAEPTDRPLIADRSADHLSKELLVEEPGSIRLDEGCTEAFFEADGAPDECRYDIDGSDLPAALHVDRPGVSVNVTIDDGDGTVRTIGGTELSAGGTPPASSSVVVARRVVLLDDRRGYLRMRVW